MKNEWNCIWKNKRGYTEFEEKWYSFLSKFSDKKNVLEVGCGTGRGLKGFKNKATGVDFSKNALKRAKEELGRKNVRLVESDARKLPFKDGTFDFVFSSGLIEHFKNEKKEDEKIVDEMVRVTKKGGTVLISVPNTMCVWYIAAKTIMTFLGKYPYPDEKSYTFLELKKMLDKRGVRMLGCAGLQLFPPSYTGWSRIYPKSLSSIFDKIEKVSGNLRNLFSFAIICWGEV